MNASSTPSIQSVDRIFAIIETLSLKPGGLTIAELAKSTQLPKGTVSRMLATLITKGYVMQNIESKEYCLTMRLFEIGARARGGSSLLAVARPYLDSLAAKSAEAVHLVVRDSCEIVYLYKAEPSSSFVSMGSCVGLRNPMYCTGVGKSILACLPEAEVRRIWDNTELVKYTQSTITDFDAMKAELERIRARGYATDMEEHETGVVCVAVPILDFCGEPFAAISISAPAARMCGEKLSDYAGLIKASVSEISRFLGTI